MCEITKRKLEIRADLSYNDPRYTFFTPESTKSSVWKNFHIIKLNNVTIDFARCNHCGDVLSYTSRRGTGSLLRHKCYNSRSVSATQALLSASKLSDTLLNCDITKQQLLFTIKDLQPLSAVQGKGFKELGQSLINIGAQYGQLNIEDVLISSEILAENIIPTEYIRLQEQLEPELCNNELAFTTDLWTVQRSQRSFLTLSAHYITADFVLKSRMLGTREFSNRITALEIQNTVLEILAQIKINTLNKQTVFVTDNSTIVGEAFKKYERLTCACQNLNAILDSVLEKHNIPELQALISEARQLYGYSQPSNSNWGIGHNSEMSSKQHLRWSTVVTMLCDIYEKRDEIWELLIHDENKLNKIAVIDINLLEQVIQFLTPFKHCSEQLSAVEYPTINEYTLWYERLLKQCDSNAEDSPVVYALKSLTRMALAAGFQPTSIHNVALFLNPPFKQLQFLSEEKRNCIFNTVKELLLHIKETDDEMATVKEETFDESGEYLATTSQNSRNCYFMEFQDKYDNSPRINAIQRIDTEVEMYKVRSVSCCDLLEFWKNASDFPMLRRLSRRILNIPTSSVSSEMLFSASAGILGFIKFSN